MGPVRELVAQYMPRLVGDKRFTVVSERDEKWGFIVFQSSNTSVCISVHHSGKRIDFRRAAGMWSVTDDAGAVRLLVYLEDAPMSELRDFHQELEYIDRRLDVIESLTETREAWDEFKTTVWGRMQADTES